jgi:hypothetical protein
MKKIALAVASLCIAATPVLACPHMEKAESEKTEPAPRTAEKKQEDKAKDTKDTKDTKTAKPVEKQTDKKADKVSQR